MSNGMRNGLKYWLVVMVLDVLMGTGAVYGETIVLDRCESSKIETSLHKNCEYLEGTVFESARRQNDEPHFIAGSQMIAYDPTANPTNFIQTGANYAYVGWVPDVIRSNVSTPALTPDAMPSALNYTLAAGLQSDGFRSNTPAELSKVSSSEYSRDKVISGPLFASILALIGIVAVSRRNVS